MSRNKIFYLLFFCIIFLFSTKFAFSQQRINVTNWYIKQYDADIVLNQDSSATVIEKITADAGNCVNCHGIFRIIPTKTTLENGKTIQHPTKITSITDFTDRPLKYSTSLDRYNNTITYKIGDPNKLATGINYFKIVYRVDNVILDQEGFDEFYWNILGNYWDLEIDQFTGLIHFPSGLNKDQTQTWLYSGAIASKNTDYADYSWIDQSTVKITNTKTLPKNTGITISTKIPKEHFTYWQPSWWDKNSHWLWQIIPILTFIVCLYIWNKFGKDPHGNKTIVPEFSIPGNLSPLEMEAITEYGAVSNNAITATIVNLAVKKYLTINETKTKGLFKKTDYTFKNLFKEDNKLSLGEEKLINLIFSGSEESKMSELAKDTSTASEISELRQIVREEMDMKNLIPSNSIWIWGVMIGLGILIAGSGLTIGFALINLGLSISIFLSGLIIFMFALLMPKRTVKGSELQRQIQGFKLYINTAEKYRQRFNEKENIFEQFLPYAILFGLTKKWIETCKKIYGAKYFESYHPYWYAGSFATFNADTLSSAMNNLSSSIGSSVGTSSGVGGSGGVGGGGGGGGGGGW